MAAFWEKWTKTKGDTVDAWLASLAVPSQSSRGLGSLSSSGSGVEPLRKAAACYVRAGWDEDACSVFEAIGNLRSAAAIHERQGRFSQAADAYRRAGEWRLAAQCFLELKQPAAAADCFAQAGDRAEAAWIYADQAQAPTRAEELLGQRTGAAAIDPVPVNLIRARIAIARSERAKAALILRGVIEDWTRANETHLRAGIPLSRETNALSNPAVPERSGGGDQPEQTGSEAATPVAGAPTFPSSSERVRVSPIPMGRLFDWALILANLLDRPDFARQLFMVRPSHWRIADARLSAWSEEVLGIDPELTGVMEDAASSAPEDSESAASGADEPETLGGS